MLITLAVFATGLAAFADDLDAKLEAQKKKAHRKVYSDYALLEDQKMEVPREETEEQKGLDKKLKEMEKQQEALANSPATQPNGQQVTPAAAPKKAAGDNDWLIKAVAGEQASLTNELERALLDDHLERMKEKKAQEALALKEKEAAEKLQQEREKKKKQDGPADLPGLVNLQQYQPDPLKITRPSDDSREKSSTGSAGMPAVSAPDPLAIIRPAQKTEKDYTPPLFSPEAARAASMPGSFNIEPFSTAIKPPTTVATPAVNSSPPGMPQQQTFTLGSGFTTPGANNAFQPKPAPTPMELIRKSSPIYRADPFTEERMPQIKKNIWE